VASRPKFWPRPRPQTFGLDLASISLSYYVIGHFSGKKRVKFGNFVNFYGNNLKSYVVKALASTPEISLGLGLVALASASASRFWPRLTSLHFTLSTVYTGCAVIVVGRSTVRRDDSRVQDGRLVPCNDHQPRLWTRVGRLSRLLVLRDDPAVSVPGAGRPGHHGRQSDARSHRSHGRLVRRQSDRNLRRLGDVRSLRRAERRRPSTVRRRLRLVCRLCCANRRSSVLRRKRSAATKHRTDQGSTTLFFASRYCSYSGSTVTCVPMHHC